MYDIILIRPGDGVSFVAFIHNTCAQDRCQEECSIRIYKDERGANI